MVIDLKDTKERILDELADAVEYMEKAVEHKGTEWGSWFCSMSKNELEHANLLLKMFNKAEKPDSLTEAAHTDMYKAIMDAYITHMNKIEALKKLYWSE